MYASPKFLVMEDAERASDVLEAVETMTIPASTSESLSSTSEVEAGLTLAMTGSNTFESSSAPSMTRKSGSAVLGDPAIQLLAVMGLALTCQHPAHLRITGDKHR